MYWLDEIKMTFEATSMQLIDELPSAVERLVGMLDSWTLPALVLMDDVVEVNSDLRTH